MDKVELAKWFVCLATLVVVVLLAVSLTKLNKKGSGGSSSKQGGRDRSLNRRGRNAPGPNPVPSGCVLADPPCMDEPGVCDMPGGCKCCKMSSQFMDAHGTKIRVPMKIYGPVPGGDCICIAPNHPDCDAGCYPGCETDDGSFDQNCLQGCFQACGKPIPGPRY
jgi:hypothetical protein